MTVWKISKLQEPIDMVKAQGNFYPKKFYPLQERNRQWIFSTKRYSFLL